MKIEPFLLERWMTAHELSATYDIAESGILPLSLNDLLAFEEPDERKAILEGLLGPRSATARPPGRTSSGPPLRAPTATAGPRTSS
jgi:hypothetical protein